jgi:pilus assembly protein CpaF
MIPRNEIYRRSTDYFLDPVRPLLTDPGVSEVLINGGAVYYERAGRLHPWPESFGSEELLRAAAVNIAEYVDRPLDDDHPAADARLPDGSRVHLILPPLSRQGICISIRKFPEVSFTLDRLKEGGSLTDQAAEFLELAVLLRKNIAIAGGTGTGKTSLLNALSGCIPEHERIIVIEDSSELKLHQPHTVYLEAQPAQPGGRDAVTIRELFAHSLRMRPDRIIVGEVRRGEALDMLQAMIAGHSGALTTVHAASPRAAAARLEMLSMQSDVALPASVARAQVAQAIDLVVQIVRDHDGTRRITRITELVDVDPDGEYRFRDIFRFASAGRTGDGHLLGNLQWTGTPPSFAVELHEQGYAAQTRLCESMFAESDHDNSD